MNFETLTKAEKEAAEFLKLAKTVREKAETNKFTFYGCKETGALRRKSMDLTRALTEMRKPN